ncbi:MAG: Ig-like domain-containing protein [Oscillospiraceae bacterium]|nr:Ig-like domain-containing protein [Oscillospiraceae bacterium]
MTQIKFVIILLVSMICFCGCKKTEHIEIEYGKTFELVNGTLSSYDGVTWSSNNENVVSIEDGKTISAKEPGSAIVRGMKNNKAVLEYNVDVILVPIEKIELSEVEAEMNVGDTKTLKYKLLPDNASDYGVKWVSEDETVVTVNEKGNITAVNAGTTYVKAISDNRIESSEFKAVVKDHPDFPDPEEYGFDVVYFELAPSEEVKKRGADKHMGKSIMSRTIKYQNKDQVDYERFYAIELLLSGFETEEILRTEPIEKGTETTTYKVDIIYYDKKPVATLETLISRYYDGHFDIAEALREYKK